MTAIDALIAELESDQARTADLLSRLREYAVARATPPVGDGTPVDRGHRPAPTDPVERGHRPAPSPPSAKPPRKPRLHGNRATYTCEQHPEWGELSSPKMAKKAKCSSCAISLAVRQGRTCKGLTFQLVTPDPKPVELKRVYGRKVTIDGKGELSLPKAAARIGCTASAMRHALRPGGDGKVGKHQVAWKDTPVPVAQAGTPIPPSPKVFPPIKPARRGRPIVARMVRIHGEPQPLPVDEAAKLLGVTPGTIYVACAPSGHHRAGGKTVSWEGQTIPSHQHREPAAPVLHPPAPEHADKPVAPHAALQPSDILQQMKCAKSGCEAVPMAGRPLDACPVCGGKEFIKRTARPMVLVPDPKAGH